MTAFILAAGLGTRLLPLTKDRPKALVQIDGKTLLEIAINNLIRQGFSRIVVNVYHFAPMIIDYLRAHEFAAEILISDESEKLMDTGGALIFARNLLDQGEPFLVHNVDILSNIDLGEMYSTHIQSGALVSMAVSNRNSSRKLLFDNEMNLRGWRDNSKGTSIIPCGDDTDLEEFAFSGIHVVSPNIYNRVSRNEPFSIVNEYLNLCINNKIIGINYSQNTVLDVGKPESLNEAKHFSKK